MKKIKNNSSWSRTAAAVILILGFPILFPRAAAAAPPEKVTVALPAIPHSAVFYVAADKGFFTKEGIEIALQTVPSGVAALAAIAEGKADLGVAADTPIMFAIARGQDLNILAGICASEKDLALIARKDRGIAHPRDLQGKKIGVTFRSSAEFFLDAFLTIHDVKRTAIKVMNLPPNEAVESLLNAKVDAISIWNPFVYQLRKGLGERATIFYGENIYTNNMNVAALRSFTEKNPAGIAKFLRALLRADTYIRENPKEVQQFLAQAIKMDLPLLTALWDVLTYKISLDQSLIISMENQTRWAIKNKLIQRGDVPNYTKSVYLDGLLAVKPEAVTIIH